MKNEDMKFLSAPLISLSRKGMRTRLFKIADRCGITRTTLYLYFKNKREIFVWSIKQLTNRVEKDLISTITNESLSYASRLESVLHVIIDLSHRKSSSV